MSDASRVTIRPAGPADAPALARLRWEFRTAQAPATEAEDRFVQRCTAWVAAQLGPGGAWRCWVAEDGGRVVGTVWLQLVGKLPNPVAEPERHGYISSLYVEPPWRGAGLGAALLRACLDACAGEAVDAVILWPTPRSRGLYHRHGFGVPGELLERRRRAELPS